LAIVGGGVIGCEFASIFAQLGTQVEIIEFLPRLLSQEDEEISRRLKIALKKLRIKINLNTGVENVMQIPDGVKLTCSNGKEITSDTILLSVGREPCCNLEFTNASLALNDENAITIDDNFETNLKNVFAIGDVTGKMLLAHTASKQGTEVAQIITDRLENKKTQTKKLNYNNIPRCTFTNPEVASVGLTEKKAKEKFTDIKVGKFPFKANGKALGLDETYGFVKTIASADNGQLIGMHIIGPMATELIAQGAILINNKTSANEVQKVVFSSSYYL